MPGRNALLSAKPDQKRRIRSLANRVCHEAKAGTATELSRAGSTLGAPMVFDIAAKDFKAMADKGLIAINAERWQCMKTSTIFAHYRHCKEVDRAICP